MNWKDKFKDISFLGISSTVLTVVAMADGVVAARVLGPTLLGVWMTVRLGLRYTQRLNLGVPQGFRRQTAVDEGAGDAESLQRHSDVVFTFLLVVSLLAAGVFLVASLYSDFGDDLQTALLFGSFVVVLQVLLSFVESYYKGTDRFDNFSYMELAKLAGTLASIALTVWLGFVGFLLGRVTRQVAPFVYGLYKLDYVPSVFFDSSIFKRLLRTGFLIMIVGLSSQLFQTADRTVIIWAFTPDKLGFYSTGDTFATLLMTISSVVSSVLYTSFTQQHGGETTRAAMRKNLQRGIRIFGAVLPLAFAALYLSVPTVVRVALPEYVSSITVAKGLLFGYSFFAISNIAGAMLKALNKLRLYILALLGWATINLALNVAVVGVGGGLLPVTLVTAATYAMYSATVVGLAFWSCEGTLSQFVQSALRYMVPAVLVAGYVFVVDRRVPLSTGGTLFELVVSTVVREAFVVPVAAVVAFVLVREFDTTVTSLVARIRSAGDGRR